MHANVIARKLNLLAEKAAMRSIDVANLLGTRPETVSRWNQGKAFPRSDAQRTLLDLEYIVEQLADFYEPQEARLWLFSRQKLLGGAIPADLIQAGRPTQRIFADSVPRRGFSRYSAGSGSSRSFACRGPLGTEGFNCGAVYVPRARRRPSPKCRSI
jgi:hypothetical protein